MKERLSFTEQIRLNKIKSTFLLIGIFIVLLIIGYLIAISLDPSYFFIVMSLASIISILYVFLGYYNSDKIALASVRARPATRAEYPGFLHAVENMAIAAGLPVPRAYVMDSDQINAFAAGRDPKNAVICVTTGAIRKLTKQELEGVVAHEMAHIAQYDMRLLTVATVVVGLISVVAELFLRSLWFASNNRDENRHGALILVVAIVVAILAPIIANLIALAISRKREFVADATAVKFTRYPVGLRSALIKIKHEHVQEQDRRRYTKAMAPLFISDPFKKKFRNIFSTHPSIDERIMLLGQM